MLHVYGDNILECWRLVQHANTQETEPTVPANNDILKPTISVGEREIKLMPSPDLIPINIKENFCKHKDSLRENPDAVISDETNILATFEFCSALPAGNNAWQRHGRALSICINGISHFHIAKVGGFELDKDRNKKATRLPNPLLLISYLAMGRGIAPGGSYFVPIVVDDTSDELGHLIGHCDCKHELSRIVQSLISTGEIPGDSLESIIEANIRLIESISKPKGDKKSLSRNEWVNIAEKLAQGKTDPLKEIVDVRRIEWKKSAPSNTSSTGKKLQRYMEINFQAIGDAKIPICLARKEQIKGFQEFLEELYADSIKQRGFDLQASVPGDLLITCDSGFKPRGDDSRPARGLTPFAKSLVGENSEVKILVFLYGPCKEYQWRKIKDGHMENLAQSNGLWESIYKLADFLILDSESHAHPLTVEVHK